MGALWTLPAWAQQSAAPPQAKLPEAAPVTAAPVIVAPVIAAPDVPAAAPAAKSARLLAPALISEVRAYGPGGAEDSFVEVRSTSDEPLDLSGWSLQFLSPPGQVVTVSIAPGTLAAPRGHLLLAGRRYSLGAYARADASLPVPIASGIRLRDAKGQVVDAVGPRASGTTDGTAEGTKPAAQSPALTWSEGRGLPAWAFAPAVNSSAGASAGSKSGRPAQFSCVRRRVDGQFIDTNDNVHDWVLASVTGVLAGQAVRLGAPGPQNKSSAQFAIAPLRAQAALSALGAAQPAISQPIALGADAKADAETEQNKGSEGAPGGSQRLAAQRDRSAVGPNRSQGTLVLRYRLVNGSDQALHRFRLQVVGATTGASPLGIADLRLLPLPPALKPKASASTSDAPATSDAPSRGEAQAAAMPPGADVAPVPAPGAAPEAPVLYGVLDEPPAQSSGGGFNSSLSFEPAPGGIAPGEAVELRILLGVEKLGRYRLALDGGGLSIVFNGHVQARGAQARVAEAWARSSRAGRQASNSRSGWGQSGGLGSQPDPARGSEAVGQEGSSDQTIIASIVLEGNTEDGVEPPVEDSPLGLSGSEVKGETNTILLRFLGPIDPASVADGAAFAVTVNGQEIQATASVAGASSVLLRLPEGAMRPGDQVQLRWDKLRDTRGRRVSGQAGPLRVP